MFDSPVLFSCDDDTVGDLQFCAENSNCKGTSEGCPHPDLGRGNTPLNNSVVVGLSMTDWNWFWSHECEETAVSVLTCF